MADSAEAAPDTGSDAQITFKVKTSGDKTHTITMAESATVLDLKTKLAASDFEDTPVDRQRLIYSGRIMKDPDALSVYKIKDMNTIHLVKSARSNPTPAARASSSTPAQPAVPQNMAAGSSAGDLLAGLTGARFAGHANLPSADLFGADGGMGPPPNEEQMAELLSDPMVVQSMNEALNNPTFIDYMIRTNPALAGMPNAREILQSPYFRNMMTDPQAIRMAARMRRMFQGGGAPAFPAPGATDNTPAAAPQTEGSGTAANSPNETLLRAILGAQGGPAGAANPFGALFTVDPLAATPPGAGAAGAAPAASNQTAAASANTGGSAGSNSTTQGPAGAAAQPANPFAALFGAGNVPGQAAPGGNPNPFGLPPIPPEAMQQVTQMLGLGLPPAAAVARPDNRPPEERYAEQLRQLNDMGFFDFERNVTALRRSGGSVQGAIEYLLSNI